ncbi:flagellar hook-associated protein 2 [Propionispira arboris]|uniref:Flagellar hook-associated protein 2 n=1 Tax=Propionispira arboris TaxID=84035 RepID=A0A1H7CF78_9FIRM|nr:flagellar filament capping protein FliD [Propionispira arboris]SEJ88126.1 flagellar hook-associated protein 2 [Propionispira arboris]
MSQTKGVSVSNTGMDMDALVKASVTTYQSKYDAAYKKETVAEWTKSAYADLYTELAKFKATASDYKLQSKTTAHTTTSGDSSVVTATANGDALNLSHDVTVNTVARNASLQSKSAITRATGTSTSKLLSDVAGITLTDDNKDSLAVAISFDVQDSATSTEKRTVSYTYKDLQTKTLTDMASDIKNLTTKTTDDKTINTNITASYDATNDTMNIYNKKAGADNIIKISANTSSISGDPLENQTKTLLTNLHLATYDGATLSSPLDATALNVNTITGVSSSITVDGQTYTGDTNAITVAGVTYTANKKSSSGSTTVSIGTDTDTLVKSVQTFVDSYNTLLDKMTAQLHATKSSTYGALTSDQKSAMTADEITAWETKAKTGILRNDSILSQTVDDMRNAMTMTVSGGGLYKTAGSIGLTVGDWKTYGHITLDTDKLKAAIADDPSIVDKILAGDNKSTSTTDMDSQGVATRLSNLLTVDLKNFSDKAGTSASTSDTSVLGTQITDMNTNLTALLKALQDKQDYYYTKYNAMESAVGQLTSSLTSVTSFLG